MNVDQATKIILKPYITEKTFAMVENESKICFIVERLQVNLRLQKQSIPFTTKKSPM